MMPSDKSKKRIKECNILVEKWTHPFVLLFFCWKKTFWDQRVGVRKRVVVLNAGTNETHGFAKMGGREPDEN